MMPVTLEMELEEKRWAGEREVQHSSCLGGERRGDKERHQERKSRKLKKGGGKERKQGKRR